MRHRALKSSKKSVRKTLEFTGYKFSVASFKYPLPAASISRDIVQKPLWRLLSGILCLPSVSTATGNDVSRADDEGRIKVIVPESVPALSSDAG
jgi:hypothetical protein